MAGRIIFTSGHHDSERQGQSYRASDSHLQGFMREDKVLTKVVHSSLAPPFHFYSPSLFQRTDCCPLLSPWVITLNRLKEFSIGASSHCIDFLLHSCIAANLVGKGKAHLKLHRSAEYQELKASYIHTHVFGLSVPMSSITSPSQSFVMVYKERSCSSLS